ncbi:MAG: ABC transporter substrate-binding protein [Actinomycetota bacterium]
MKRRSALAALVIALSMVATGCTGGGNEDEGDGGGTNGGAKEGGVLRIGTSSGISSMNPFVGFNQDDYAVWMYVYPSLLQTDTTTGEYMPNLATSWDISKDGRTVTWHLVEGASWSDGEPLNAEDVAWTIDTILKYPRPTGAWEGSVGFLENVEATDDTTLVATYEQPSSTALTGLGGIPILPPQVWETYAIGDGKALKTFENVPEGGEPLTAGGPFMLTEYRKNDIALFETNPNWFGPEPHIDGFGLQFYANEDAMITALKTDQLDAINEVPPTSVDTLAAANMVVFEGPALALRDLIINSNPEKPENRELLDPKVREAFEYAVDREQIVETAWLGHATPGTTLIPEGDLSGGIDWHNPNIEPLPFDIAKANEILDSLGYERGPDGIRSAGDHQMSYEVIFPNDEAGAGDRAFQIIQDGFREIGVELIQKKMDNSAAFDAIGAPDYTYLDMDFAMWDWFPALDPDFLLAAMTCDQYGIWNDTGYCDPEYEELYTAQQTAVDPEERRDIVYEMQELVYNDRPYIILTYDSRLDAWSPAWDGFVESSQGFFNAFSTQSLLSVHQV